MSIFIWRDNDEYGPFTRSEILACLLRGEVRNEDYARTEVEGEWRSLKEVLQSTLEASNSSGSLEETEGQGDLHAGEAATHPDTPAKPGHGSADEAWPRKIMVCKGDEVFGPYGQEEVFAALFRGEWTSEDLACREGQEEWLPLREVLKGGMGRLILPEEKQPIALESAVVAPCAEEAVVEADYEGPPAGVQFDGFNARIILGLGLMGMIMAFGATYFVLRARDICAAQVLPQTPPTAKATQPFPSAPASTPSPYLLAASSPLSRPKPASSAGAVQAKQSAPVPRLLTSTKQALASSTPKRKPKPKPPVSPAGSPRMVLAKAREITLPSVVGVDSASMWVADTADKPKGALVICIETNTRPQDVVSQRAWQEFARKNQLELAAISFTSTYNLMVSGGGYCQADKGSGDTLLSGLQQAWAKPLPLILYGRGGGAVFAASFVNWRPQGILTWAAYTNDWFIQPAPEKTPVPAIIACDRAKLKGGVPVLKFFQAGRTQGNPWTFISLEGTPNQCRQLSDQFFREYLPAALAVRLPVGNAGLWANVDTGRPASTLDVMTQPTKLRGCRRRMSSAVGPM